MSAGQLNLTIEQGATYEVTLTIQDDVGAAVDLTNVTVARMQIRPSHGSEKVILDLTLANNGLEVVAPATDGKLKILVTATLSGGMDSGGPYDLELEYADGTVTRLIEGRVTLRPQVTR